LGEVVLNANSSPVITDWTGSGASPYIDATDASYVANSTKNVNSAEFTFEESADLGTITSVIFSVRALSLDGKGDLKIDESPDNGSKVACTTIIVGGGTGTIAGGGSGTIVGTTPE